VIGIYLAEEITFQKARKRILEVIGEKLPYRSYEMKSNNNLPRPNYKSFHFAMNRVPILPIALLTGFTFIALAWNTNSQRGLCSDLINIMHNYFVPLQFVIIPLPFVVVILLLLFFSSRLNYDYIYKKIGKESKNNNLDWNLLYLLRLKRYELYFLFASIVLIFLLFTKTFSYVIYYYGNFSLPGLYFLGTLKSYNPNGFVYAISTTVILVSISYLLPMKIHKRPNGNILELENKLLDKSETGLSVTVTDSGGNKFSGYVHDIGSMLGIQCKESKVSSKNNKIAEEKNSNDECFFQWDSITSIKFNN
jgi:hypothetical protein